MSGFDSYLYERRLPENETLKTIHNIITLLNISLFFSNHLVQYMSPSSRESFYWKLIAHLQAISIFSFSCVWSILSKPIPHLDFHFFYCEGYYYRIGITCAGSYVLVCITFGSYATSTVAGYMYRLYLLVDHNHILKKPYVLPLMFIILQLMSCASTSTTFYVAYSEFDPYFFKTLPLNLTNEQIVYFKDRSAAIYNLHTFTQHIHPLLFFIILILCLAMSILSSIATFRTIQKKQTMMSAGTTKHHLRVLKILTIQTSVNTSISCLAPTAIALTAFVPVNSYIIYASLIVLGINSMLHSLLTIYLNPLLRKTVTAFLNQKMSTLTVSTGVVGEFNRN